jgi:hypothetical protein
VTSETRVAGQSDRVSLNGFDLVIVHLALPRVWVDLRRLKRCVSRGLRCVKRGR